MNSSIPSGCSFPNTMVDQRPAYDRQRRRKSNGNQVMSKSGVIRPDRRKKAKYL